MQAMVLKKLRTPLEWTTLPDRHPGSGQIRVKVTACGVCRTDLHVVDGELADPQTPIIPGHEIVGRIDAIGTGVEGLTMGERVGIPWLGHTCGLCPYCRIHRENLCDHPIFTGYTRDGGFATATIADARFAFPLGEAGADVSLAPLLCAGLIGWRSLDIAGDGQKLGLYGFGAAAHIVAQVAIWQGRSVFAFTRPGDVATQAFARTFGVTWAGGSDELPPEQLDAATICDSWGSRPLGAQGNSQRRPPRLRRHSYERHSELSLCATLGRASAPVGRQSYATRWHRFPAQGSRDGHNHAHHYLSTQERQPGPRRFARRPLRRRCRACALSRASDRIH